MEEAFKIFDYLPLSYKTPTEAEYVNFLWESFEVNYNAEKYPFAFIAFNMLYMSFVYFEVWQIKQNRRRDFEMAMVGFRRDDEKELTEATTPFSFSLINERSFFRFLKLLNCRNDRIGNFGKIIDARNQSAHSNGNILFNSQPAIDGKINDVLSFVDEIQNLSKPIVDDCLIEFLKNSWNADERPYLDDAEQIREVLIHDNYLSQKDIELIRGFDISRLSTEEHFAEMENLFHIFAELYKPDE
ncbi:MAG TPA: hypothetical protein VGW12_18360 [Pyrinomonadaceae bacterium]|nr:hypothetical protein [Pyrinomonadaceae bacterium]